MKFSPPASMRQTRMGLLCAFIAFVADQLSKVWLVDYFHLAEIQGGVDVLPLNGISENGIPYTSTYSGLSMPFSSR